MNPSNALPPPLESDAAARPDRRGRWWPWVIGGFLGLTVIKYAIVLAMVGNDPSIAVQPDYYQKALAWDEQRAIDAASDELGWHAQVEVGPSADRRGLARTRITDATGAPIAGAAVKFRIFHHARAARPVDATTTTDADGSFEVSLPFSKSGMWEAELDVERGEERFRTTRTIVWGTLR